MERRSYLSFRHLAPVAVLPPLLALDAGTTIVDLSRPTALGSGWGSAGL
ncbi:MAG: hypothetical protein WAS21_10940 [Geminicoccaceae bacterium]